MLSVPQTSLVEITSHVRDCVCAALLESAADVEGRPGCPCRAFVAPGGSANLQNECCGYCSSENEGGQLTVNVERIYPSVAFPRQDTNADLCTPHTWVADLNVRLLRCVPVYDGDGPDGASPQQQQAAADIGLFDATALVKAAACCVPDRPGQRKPMKTVVTGMLPVYDAGCAGWDMRILVDIGSCACPDEGS